MCYFICALKKMSNALYSYMANGFCTTVYGTMFKLFYISWSYDYSFTCILHSRWISQFVKTEEEIISSFMCKRIEVQVHVNW